MLFLVLTDGGVFVSLWRSIDYAVRAANKRGPGHVVAACEGGMSQSIVYRTSRYRT